MSLEVWCLHSSNVIVRVRTLNWKKENISKKRWMKDVWGDNKKIYLLNEEQVEREEKVVTVKETR